MNEKKSLISVIVPVYNTERFLPKCIESICRQSYRNLQIILVDDGSPDRCGEICDEYVVKDSRIEVIHQANHGVVRAREAGILAAEGEYIAFVDSDDWIESDMYEKMLELSITLDYDIVWCNVFVEADVVSEYQTYFNVNPQSILKQIMKRKTCGWLFNKLIKTTYWHKCNIFADESNTICEDELISVQLLINDPLMAICRSPLYHYVKYNNNSQLTLALGNDDYILKGFNNWIHIGRILKEKNQFSIYEKDYHGRIVWYKCALLQKGYLRYAQSTLPTANKYEYLSTIKVCVAVQLLFYAILNGGLLGRLLWKLYLKCWKK